MIIGREEKHHAMQVGIKMLHHVEKRFFGKKKVVTSIFNMRDVVHDSKTKMKDDRQ